MSRKYTAVRSRWHAQKPDIIFRQNGRVHVTQWGWQFSRLLAAQVCGSAGRAGSICTLLERLCSAVLRGMLGTHSISPSLLPCVAVCHIILIGLYCLDSMVCCWVNDAFISMGQAFLDDDPLKLQEPLTQRHSITSHRTQILSSIAVRTSDLTQSPR
jgi:hypothetical protein